MARMSGWKRLFRLEENPNHIESQINEEFRFHVEQLAERLMAEGLTEEAAWAEAERRFGDAEGARSGCQEFGEQRLRREAIGKLFTALLRNTRLSFRIFLKDAGFTSAVVVCLALGIGATTSIFSVLHAVVIRPLPFTESDRLVMVWETFRTRNMTTGAVSYPNLSEWRERNRVFECIGAYHPIRHTLTGVELPERILGGRADAEFFRTLGVEPAVGRTILPEDDRPGAEEVVMISDGLWRRHFGGDPDVLGQTLNLDNHGYTVIGVLPPGFSFPVYVADAEVWTSTSSEVIEREHREWPVLIAVGRLGSGVSLQEAQSHMDAIALQLEAEFPETNTEHGFNLVPLQRQTSGEVRPLLYLLLGATLLVLLIACTNVANLLMARSSRRGDLTVRAALGAGRSDLVFQVFTESLLLSLLGGGLGVLLAVWGTEALVALIPSGFPRSGEIGVSGGVLLFALILSLLTGLAFGLIPAVNSTRINLSTALSESGRHTTGWGHRITRRSLVVMETAMALILLTGAGLLIRSFRNMMNVDPGFDPENVLTFSMSREWHDYHVVRRGEFYISLSEQIAGLPGVVAAGAGEAVPMMGGFRTIFWKEGETDVPRAERPVTRYISITPSYFETLRIPLLRGRSFTGRESRESPGVAIINWTAAELFWPDEDPLGKRIISDVDITSMDPTEFEVIGIVGDVRDVGLDVDPGPCLYVPCTQQTWPYATFALRTSGDPMAAAAAVRDLVASVTSEAAFSFRTLDSAVGNSIRQRRFPMFLLSLFAGIALLLAAIGIYGVLSYTIVQRYHEIGIRTALGASPFRIVRLFMREGLSLAGIGVVIGVGVALMISDIMTGLLFGIEPADPMNLAIMTLLLFGVATAACYLPTLHAIRIDPLDTLRSE